jgi:asparagine synthetase B (glutamine-hydrolysing)
LASVLAPATQGSAVACSYGIPDSQEVILAHAVANRLGMPWKCVPLGPSDFITHAAEGVRITEGLDLCVQSYGLVVYPKLSQEADIAFTGLALDVSLGGSYLDACLFNSDMDSEKALAIIRRKLSYFDDDLLRQLFGSSQIVQTAENLLREVWEPNLMQTNWNDFADQFALRFRASRMLFMRQNWQRLFLEDATPTFDNDFVDLILQIPTHERINHRIYKRFMQCLCPHLMDIPYQRTLLPPSVPIEFWEEGGRLEAQREALYENIWRATGQHIPYMRYATNYNEWFRMDAEWIKWTDNLLLGTECRLIGLGLNHKTVRQILEEHRNGRRNHRQGLLQLLTLELFLREFFS